MLTRISILVLLLAGACLPNPVEDPPQPQSIPVDATHSPTDITATPSAVLFPAPVLADEPLQKLTQMVIDDLAKRLAPNVESIRVVSVEPTVWRDA
jgi:hypothetical protein